MVAHQAGGRSLERASADVELQVESRVEHFDGVPGPGGLKGSGWPA